jgi:hypothetical protein
MRNWQTVAIVVGVAWLGAFAISFAVAEWRGGDNGNGNEQTVLGAESPAAFEPPTTIPTPPPPEMLVAPAVAGTTGEWQGIQFTIDEFRTQEFSRGVFMFFTLENLDGDPFESTNFANVKVVDIDGFDCSAGVVPQRGTPNPLPRGEKATAYINYECEAAPKTLTFTRAVELEFPPA